MILDFLFEEKDIVETSNNMHTYLISEETKDVFLRQLSIKRYSNIYYIFDYNIYFKNLLHKFKEEHILSLGKFIADITRLIIYDFINENNIDLIVPIPINKKRKVERGFNQVEKILDYLNLKYVKIERVKYTEKMKVLSNKEERQKNIENSFYCSYDLSNKKILIVDDVITTGSTVEEMVRYIQKRYTNVEIKILCFSMAKSYLRKENNGKNF